MAASWPRTTRPMSGGSSWSTTDTSTRSAGPPDRASARWPLVARHTEAPGGKARRLLFLAYHPFSLLSASNLLTGGPNCRRTEGCMTVERLRQGEPQVLAELLEQHGREIQGVAYLILRNAADAEDVLMDTLLIALDRGSALRDAAAMRPWLLKIATNQALSRRRRFRRVTW